MTGCGGNVLPPSPRHSRENGNPRVQPRPGSRNPPSSPRPPPRPSPKTGIASDPPGSGNVLPPVIPVKTGIHASNPDRGAGIPRHPPVMPPSPPSPRHSRENGNPRVQPRSWSRNARHPPAWVPPACPDRAPIPAIPGRRLSRLWWSRIAPGGPSRGIARCPPPPAGCSGCFPWPWGRLWPERWPPERSCPGR